MWDVRKMREVRNVRMEGIGRTVGIEENERIVGKMRELWEK